MSAFSFDGAARDDFNEVPLAFVCKTFRQSARRFCFPRVQLERLLETLRSPVRVWWGEELGVVDTQRSERRREGRGSLEGDDKVLVCFLTMLSWS